ncbi:RHS repeat-associated core domain-containing protein [Pseudomonas sp. MNR3A]|uniref:RHS repeat-associated core domain-containing protein n=1 Tax=Pseudomonas sp. MNR3A TaxID=2615213 RepID=UPI00129BAE0C|nr:RHS repeat-associated core domain-containing protein [Pseudomonas sp. MNR3A]
MRPVLAGITKSAALHAGTPTLTGSYRTLTLLRSPATADAPPRALAQRRVDDRLCRTTRLFGARPLVHDATGNADAITVSTLTDQPLLLHTADGDASLTLLDSAGRALWSLNSQKTTTATIYEAGVLGGRPLALMEMAAGIQVGRVRERYSYAPAQVAQWKARNLCGHLLETRHNAGIDRSLRLSLTGHPLVTEQCLLKVEIEQPDWSFAVEEDVEEPLAVLNQFDASGALLGTAHAADVTVIQVYGVSGAREQTRVRYLKGGSDEEVVTLRNVRYAADSRLLEQTAGNGVVERYEYDPRTLRLRRHLTARPSGHPLGSLVISDLRYHYDPGGNILSIDDRGADPEWHNNQQATGLRHYVYDTLNRLVSATGRERVAAARHHPLSGIHVDPSAGRVWIPYSEAYSYDDGNNLWLIRHDGGAGQRTRELDVALGSNRAMIKGAGVGPEAGFMVGGLQKQLADGRVLRWHADNQLKAVTLLSRKHAADDSECYHYSTGGSRTRKVHTVTIGGGTQTRLATYTHAFEVRQHVVAGVATPLHHVLITNVGAARLVRNELNGETQLRFGFSDHLNSSEGETDAAGKVIVREEYAPYGGTVGSDEPATETDTMTQRTLRHAGKELDATGLYYYGWRYYQPQVGRWLSADPGGLIDGTNLFRMNRSSPVTLVDLDGQAPKEIAELVDRQGEGYSYPETVNQLMEKTDAAVSAGIAHYVDENGYRVISTYKREIGPYAFKNSFFPAAWVMESNYKSEDERIHPSSVVIEQYKLVAEKNAYQLPRTIWRWDVTNRHALAAVEPRKSERHFSQDARDILLRERFLASIGNGSHTRYILKDLQMVATRVEVHKQSFVEGGAGDVTAIAIHTLPKSLMPEGARILALDGKGSVSNEVEREVKLGRREGVSRRMHMLGHSLNRLLRSTSQRSRV